MLTTSLSLHLPNCPLAYSRCYSVLRTRLALPLLQSASSQSQNTSRPRSSTHGCRVRAMTTMSTEDASKATASEMKQVSKCCDAGAYTQHYRIINAQDFAIGLHDELCCRAMFSMANGLSLLVRSIVRCLLSWRLILRCAHLLGCLRCI